MDDRRAAKEFLVPFIQKITGWMCIWSKQDGPKPKGNYISLDLSPERGFGDDKKILPDDPDQPDILQRCISGIKECTLKLDAWGKGANDMLEPIWQKLQTEEISNELFRADIAALGAAPVQDLTELTDGTRYSERANLDITVSYTRRTADPVQTIGSVNIKGELRHGVNSPPVPQPDANIDVKIDIEEE